MRDSMTNCSAAFAYRLRKKAAVKIRFDTEVISAVDTIATRKSWIEAASLKVHYGNG
jgi:hypothetical protein